MIHKDKENMLGECEVANTIIEYFLFCIKIYLFPWISVLRTTYISILTMRFPREFCPVIAMIALEFTLFIIRLLVKQFLAEFNKLFCRIPDDHNL